MLGVTELSWCCKNGVERESLTEADEVFRDANGSFAPNIGQRRRN
ncbi:hypothetical protein X756_02765 [Mesorhizobium sp. LSHC412B00]|nr:hypothetical protein X756_02765 [Mesorhizobium sp. LSHC412B00]